MNLTQKQCDFILNSKFCIVATSNKQNQPRACVVMPEMAFDDKVIIADCQMDKTRENVLENPKVFLSFYDNDLEWCMKCDGTAEYICDVENSGGGQVTGNPNQTRTAGLAGCRNYHHNCQINLSAQRTFLTEYAQSNGKRVTPLPVWSYAPFQARKCVNSFAAPKGELCPQ
jgi:hypothetical protein